MNEAPTPRQAELVAFIREFRSRNHYSPTIAEMADHFHVADNAIQDHVNALAKKRLLTTRPNTARTIVLAEDIERAELFPELATGLLMMSTLLRSLLPRLSPDERSAARSEISQADALLERVKKATP